jgi:hypothetical protein
MPILPKTSESLPAQDPDDIDKYTFRVSETPEISPENHTATFTFETSRDEPYNDDNRIWINWGVFDSPFDTDINKVYGSRDSQDYAIDLTYNDYYDRVFINGLYWTLGLVGTFTYWAALPLQLVPMTLFIFYVFLQPVTIWFTAPISKNFTFDQYFFSVFLRW